MTRIWKEGLHAIPSVGVSLLPKVACPACWPAYAAVLSSLGLGFLISAKYLLPLTAAFLAFTAGSLGFRASQNHAFGPFWLGSFAVAVVLVGKFYFDWAPATYCGAGLLIVASAGVHGRAGAQSRFVLTAFRPRAALQP